MDTFDVIPGVGVGPVRLGMTRADVHAALGPPSGSTPGDTWWEGALRVHYASDTVERIEVVPGPTLHARLEGHDVLTIRVTELVKFLYARARYDPNDPELGYRFHFPPLGLTLRRVTIPQGPNDVEGQYFTSVTLARPAPGP